MKWNFAKNKNVVWACPDGVNTADFISYSKHEMGCERVVAMTVDLDQGEDLESTRLKALQAGAGEVTQMGCQIFRSRLVKSAGKSCRCEAMTYT